MAECQTDPEVFWGVGLEERFKELRTFVRKIHGLGDRSCGLSWLKKLDQESTARLGEVKRCVAGVVKSVCRKDKADRM